jgi:malate/lactate dehydrogenase
LHGEYGIKDEIYLGTLAIINGQGISHVLELPLNDGRRKAENACFCRQDE